MANELLKELIKCAEKCEKIGHFKNADSLTYHIIKISQQTGGWADSLARTLRNLTMGESTFTQELSNGIGRYINTVDQSVSLDAVIGPLEEMAKAGKNAMEAALEKAFSNTGAGLKGATEGLELSPDARGSGKGSAGGKDQNAIERQSVDQQELQAINIINMTQTLARSLNNAMQRINALETARRNDLPRPTDLQAVTGVEPTELNSESDE